MIRTLKAREVAEVTGGFGNLPQGGVVTCNNAYPRCCYYLQPDGSVVTICDEAGPVFPGP